MTSACLFCSLFFAAAVAAAATTVVIVVVVFEWPIVAHCVAYACVIAARTSGNISHFIFTEHFPDEMNYVWHKFYLKIGTRYRICVTFDEK